MADLTIANTIRQQLLGLGKMKVWSWGANSFAGGSNYLQFKVQGYKFKGWVKITLNGGDLYDIQYLKRGGVIAHEVKDIFFDEMVDVIDGYVETNNGKYTPQQENEIKQMKGIFEN